MLQVSKKWDRLGTGLWGYRVAKKVLWKCETPVFMVDESSASNMRDSTSTLQAKMGCVGALLGDNFTVSGREAGCVSAKRSAESSCEPRCMSKKARL